MGFNRILGLAIIAGSVILSSCGYIKKANNASFAISGGAFSEEGFAEFKISVNPLLLEHCSLCHRNDITRRTFATSDPEHNYHTARRFINTLIPAEENRLTVFSTNNHCLQSECNHNINVFGAVVESWITAENSAGSGGNGGGGSTFEGQVTESITIPGEAFTGQATMNWDLQTISPDIQASVTGDVARYAGGFFIKNVTVQTSGCTLNYKGLRIALNQEVLASAWVGPSEFSAPPNQSTQIVPASTPVVFEKQGYTPVVGDSLALTFDEVSCD